MNLRDIKKDIEYVLSSFIEDCATCVAVNPKANEKEIAALMEEGIDLYNELRDKAAAKNIEGSKKTYFNALRKEILERTDALYTKLSEAVTKPAEEKPAEAKPAAKKAPAKKAPSKKAEDAEEKPAEEKPAKKPAAKKAPAKKAEEPKAEEPKTEEPKAEEPKAE